MSKTGKKDGRKDGDQMKLNKKTLKEMIREAITDAAAPAPAAQAPETDTRQKKVASATTSGGMLSAEQYAQMLKQVLLTTKVAPQARKQALEAIFGAKGSAINTLVLQMLKGAQ